MVEMRYNNDVYVNVYMREKEKPEILRIFVSLEKTQLKVKNLG